jgi:plastocyanin
MNYFSMSKKIIILIIIILIIFAGALTMDWFGLSLSKVFSYENKGTQEITKNEPKEIENQGISDQEKPEQNNQETKSSEPEIETFNIIGKNFTFSLKEIRVKKGDNIHIVFTSEEGFHDWVVDAFKAATQRVQTGQTTEVTFVADQIGTFEYYCSVGDHKAKGMIGTLIVE